MVVNCLTISLKEERDESLHTLFVLGVPLICTCQVAPYYFLLIIYVHMYISLMIVTDVSTSNQWEPL